jgi:chaperonin cofactor prefoldin
MKADSRHRLSFLRRLRVLLRILGLTGILAIAVGCLIGAVSIPWQNLTADEAGLEQIQSYFEGASGPLAQGAVITIAAGLLALLLLMIVEFFAGLTQAAGSRSALSLNTFVQITLAISIVISLNVYSFLHYRRYDFTTEKLFTLPAEVKYELGKLRAETTIVVLQQHKTFGQLSTKPDSYDYAAERKVVEKVNDLVDQFRELGPQFRVHVLDVEQEGFDRKLDAITTNKPILKASILAAPENSIFFEGSGRVQRLSFNEFFQLDKTASKLAEDGQGNLVLHPQGIQAFTRRILAIQEKKPRVGVAVVHEWLATQVGEGVQEQLSSGGIRKTLEEYGFEVVDIVLKRKWGEEGGPEPAAYNIAESKLERLREERDQLEADIREYVDDREKANGFAKLFRERTLAELNQLFRRRFGQDLTESDRKKQLDAVEDAIKRIESRLAELNKEKTQLDEEINTIKRDDRALEDRRVGDVKSKLTRMLSDIDLLVIPRLTLINTSDDGGLIPARLHALNDEQIQAIKQFMKKGKPVLALVGPGNEPEGRGAVEPVDEFEKLLADRGIILGAQTILFDSESKGFAARRSGNQLGSSRADIPPVEFVSAQEKKQPNPVGQAMQATGRNVEAKLDIRVRHPRPVYLARGWAYKVNYQAEFVQSASESWNEKLPFVMINLTGGRQQVYLPRYEATAFDDPIKGTVDEERRGPFPIGVAVESSLPINWFDNRFTGYQSLVGVLGPWSDLTAVGFTAVGMQEKRPSSRLAVLGSGGIFTSAELKPASQQWLLHLSNWLLGRDERLPKTDDASWSYPRVKLNENQAFLWHWGTFLGLPLLFSWLGLVVLMLRRMR